MQQSGPTADDEESSSPPASPQVGGQTTEDDGAASLAGDPWPRPVRTAHFPAAPEETLEASYVAPEVPAIGAQDAFRRNPVALQVEPLAIAGRDLSSNPPSTQRPQLASYEDLGLIDVGGMGEVRRVRDLNLNRVMAMKLIRPKLLHHDTSLARFIEEAQVTAQLEHPGIVPVHEIGRVADGRYYFTMKEVHGRTLLAVLQEAHASSRQPGASAFPLRRLMDCFHRACEAVAYAHARGVVHRDLKPSNIMVGAFGEVLVLDWGLARVSGRAEHRATGAVSPIQTSRSMDRSLATRVGTVTGTPAYMSPEQARGEIEKLGPTTDVYSLGAILYELLCGAPPIREAVPRLCWIRC